MRYRRYGKARMRRRNIQTRRITRKIHSEKIIQVVR